jgi:hypothetical protein
VGMTTVAVVTALAVPAFVMVGIFLAALLI